MMCNSMDDKRRVYDRISNYPTFFWGPPIYACAVCTRPFLLLKGLGTKLGVGIYYGHIKFYHSTYNVIVTGVTGKCVPIVYQSIGNWFKNIMGCGLKYEL